jgi:hypothetical protein
MGDTPSRSSELGVCSLIIAPVEKLHRGKEQPAHFARRKSGQFGFVFVACFVAWRHSLPGRSARDTPNCRRNTLQEYRKLGACSSSRSRWFFYFPGRWFLIDDGGSIGVCKEIKKFHDPI